MTHAEKLSGSEVLVRGRPTTRQVFRENLGYVWRALRHLGVPESDLDDVVQEVFIVVHRKLPTWEGRSSIRTWLYGISIRTASVYRRKAYRRRERPTEDLPEASHHPQQAHSGETRHGMRKLDEALRALDEDKRTVFVLYEIEQMTMREVAEVVECPLPTAFSRLYAARRQIAESLGLPLPSGRSA